MSSDLFQEAVEVVLAHEGGLVDDPRDPGGLTHWGISKRSYPHLDIAALTREEAIDIYRRDWWDRYGYHRVKRPLIAVKLLDLAVNMGHPAAVTCLQRALRACGQAHILDDGVLGPKTLDALDYVSETVCRAAFRSEAAGHYRQLNNRTYLAGWLNRAYS